MVSPTPPNEHIELGTGSHTHRAIGWGSRHSYTKSKSGSKEAAAKIKAKATSMRRPSKAQERVKKRLQKALEKQVAKEAKEAEKRKHLSPLREKEARAISFCPWLPPKVGPGMCQTILSL